MEVHMARVRSPNYPAISLPDAIERVRKLHELQHQSPEEREVVAQHLGYSGLNGKSLKLLSALTKYGLMEKVDGGDLRVSDLAINILFPEGESRSTGIKDAAFNPDLFAEIRDRWPDRLPTDESLRAYLIRRQFAKSAIDDVTRNYRETIELVTRESGDYDSPVTQPEDQTMPTAQPPAPPTGAPFHVAITADAILVSGRLTTAEQVERLVKLLNLNKVMITPVDGAMATEYTDDEEGREAEELDRKINEEIEGKS